MYLITCLVCNANWTFTFKEPSDADKAFKKLSRAIVGEDLEIVDDFGIKAVIRSKIDAVQLSTVEKAFEGQAIIALFQARAQGKLNAMAQRDPQLMFLQASAAPPNGSGIIRPGG